MAAKFTLSVTAYTENESANKERTYEKTITITSGDVGASITGKNIGALIDKVERELQACFVED